MMTLDKKYRDELTLALRLREVPGKRVGDVLAEVETHVAETGEDPVAAFGKPNEYAAQVVTQIEASEGKSSSLKVLMGALATGALAFVGSDLLMGGLFADGTLPVTMKDVLVWLLVPLVLGGAVTVLFRGATALTHRRLFFGGGIALLTTIVVLTGFLGAWDVGQALFELPAGAGVGAGCVLLVSAVIVLILAFKRGRIVDPRQS